jgi:hypothetical protein
VKSDKGWSQLTVVFRGGSLLLGLTHTCVALMKVAKASSPALVPKMMLSNKALEARQRRHLHVAQYQSQWKSTCVGVCSGIGPQLQRCGHP